MSKRFSSKDLEAAMGKTKGDPNQGFKSGGGDNDEKVACRTEPLGTLKPGKTAKGKKKTVGFRNKFNDDGTLESKYSIKKNEQEAKLVSTVNPRQKREVEEIEYVDIECVKCGETFTENAALISTEYYRCNACCKPDNKQKRRRRQS